MRSSTARFYLKTGKAGIVRAAIRARLGTRTTVAATPECGARGVCLLPRLRLSGMAARVPTIGTMPPSRWDPIATIQLVGAHLRSNGSRCRTGVGTRRSLSVRSLHGVDSREPGSESPAGDLRRKFPHGPRLDAASDLPRDPQACSRSVQAWRISEYRWQRSDHERRTVHRDVAQLFHRPDVRNRRGSRVRIESDVEIVARFGAAIIAQDCQRFSRDAAREPPAHIAVLTPALAEILRPFIPRISTPRGISREPGSAKIPRAQSSIVESRSGTAAIAPDHARSQIRMRSSFRRGAQGYRHPDLDSHRRAFDCVTGTGRATGSSSTAPAGQHSPRHNLLSCR